MTDSIRLEFDPTERVGRSIIGGAQHLDQAAQGLVNAIGDLYVSGLRGTFASAFDARSQDLLAMLRALTNECDEAGRDLLTVVQRAREVDAECAGMFGTHSFLPDLFLPPGIEFWPRPMPYYPLPDFIRLRVGEGYSLVDGLQHLNAVTRLWTPMSVPGDLVRWAAIKGAGQMAAMTTSQAGFEQVLSAVRHPAFGASVGVGMGLAGGIAEWALSDDHSTEEFFTQAISGGIQGAIGLTPVGRGILIADAATQLFGHGVSQMIEDNAYRLAGGDAALAAEFVHTADKFQLALEAASLDSRMDGMVNAAINLDAQAFGEEIVTGLWGVGGVVVEGANLGQMTMDAIGQQIAENTQIDEFVSDVAAPIENAVDGFLGLFSR